MARPGQLIAAALVLLLLGALSGLIASPSASAQTYRCDISRVCDEGEAYAEAWAYARSISGGPEVPCVKPEPKAFNAAAYWGNCQSSATSGMRTFYYGGDCESRPDWNGPYPYLTGGKPRNGSVTCNAGCKQAWFSTGDGYFNGKYSSIPGTCDNYDEDKCKAQFGSGYSFNQGMSSCEPDDGKCPDGSPTNSLGQCKPEPCPAGKVQQEDGTCKNKENECPAGQVKSPDGKCLPGDGQCAKGEARGKDGTCKKDADENGTPDEEEGEPGEPGEPGEGTPEEFSGGDNCTQPPACSGSPILCGQARIQWRIECNTRKNRTIAGGMCGTPPICTGEKCDALEYNSLLMQWRTACATEKLLTLGNNGGGESGQPEWTKVGAMSQNAGLGASPDDTKVLSVKRLSVDDLDQSGIGGGGGGCIGFAASGGTGMGAGFAQAMASPPAFFCTYIGVLKAICILGAAVVSVVILVSGGKT